MFCFFVTFPSNYHYRRRSGVIGAAAPTLFTTALELIGNLSRKMPRRTGNPRVARLQFCIAFFVTLGDSCQTVATVLPAILFMFRFEKGNPPRRAFLKFSTLATRQLFAYLFRVNPCLLKHVPILQKLY